MVPSVRVEEALLSRAPLRACGGPPALGSQLSPFCQASLAGRGGSCCRACCVRLQSRSSSVSRSRVSVTLWCFAPRVPLRPSGKALGLLPVCRAALPRQAAVAGGVAAGGSACRSGACARGLRSVRSGRWGAAGVSRCLPLPPPLLASPPPLPSWWQCRWSSRTRRCGARVWALPEAAVGRFLGPVLRREVVWAARHRLCTSVVCVWGASWARALAPAPSPPLLLRGCLPVACRPRMERVVSGAAVACPPAPSPPRLAAAVPPRRGVVWWRLAGGAWAGTGLRPRLPRPRAIPSHPRRGRHVRAGGGRDVETARGAGLPRWLLRLALAWCWRPRRVGSSAPLSARLWGGRLVRARGCRGWGQAGGGALAAPLRSSLLRLSSPSSPAAVVASARRCLPARGAGRVSASSCLLAAAASRGAEGRHPPAGCRSVGRSGRHRRSRSRGRRDAPALLRCRQERAREPARSPPPAVAGGGRVRCLSLCL
ncbi:uncharacterized protein LOC121168080 [Ochotona curzoniae]|uniref:uncharacterized protein LOC121168080 n=1 Tax=Ochotona curzoniae TaxID=130825 RepID=UPI001B347BBC|nr:uncharacterized protein LOC121168080 [Ochotona curzoniae]